MKKFLFSLIFVLVSYVGFSQKGLSYQAVILDPAKIEIPGQDISSQPLVNGDVWLKFSIFNGSTLQFEEVHKTKTDNYGLVNLLIGSVSATSFNSLIWDSSQKNLQVLVSFNQGGSYTKIADQKLTYNPYALFAETAGKLGATLPISGGGTGATTAADARANLGLEQVNNTSDAAKPVSTATQAALDLKANTADVTAELALKANTADVNTAFALKADTTFVLAKVAAATIADADANSKGKIQLTGDLAGTADAPRVPGLALKANTTDVNAALDLKANSAEMVSALALKANGATVATSLNLKENAANKSLNVNSDGTSDVKYPSVKAVKDYVDARVLSGGGSSSVTDADINTNGIIRLTGDLGGTATAPTVPGLSLKANATDFAALTSSVNTNTASIVAITSTLNSEATTARAAELVLINSVAANTASITANAADITNLNSNVASNTASIIVNVATIVAEVSRATAAELALTNNISANTASISVNSTAINTKSPLASPTFSGVVTAPIYASTPQPLTDGPTISWNPSLGLNAYVTLGGNRTLSFSTTPVAGAYGTLVVTQDGIGNRTITLPSTTNVVLGSTSTTSIALSSSANAKDILNFYYDGANCYWNIGQGYGVATAAASTNLASGVTGTLAVANGGTGATTLTGLIKGNGSSAMTAAVAGTDYQAPIVLTTTGTGSATLSGTTLNIPLASSTVNTSTLSGTVALINGGTGQTSIAGIQSTLGLAGTKVAIGATAGATTQGSGAIAIGNAAGNSAQGSQSVAIGYVAGQSNQGANSVAIGSNAAQAGQGTQSVAIGLAANSAANNSTALGANTSAGHTNATAIGFQAATTANNTIQLGADGITVVGSTAITNVKTSGTLTAGTVTYPNTHAGTSGQVLTSLGSGTLTWTTPTSSGSSTHVIGESYGGGIVFYTWDGGAHGLIGANTELNSGQAMTWGGGSGTYVGTTSFYGVMGGKLNTQRILNVIPVPTYGNGDPQTGQRCAAYWAATYLNSPVVVSGVTTTPQFSDWYLPNAYELTLFATQSSYFPNCNFATHDHWSSSERSDYAYLAYALAANSSTNTYQDAKTSTKYVLAIRSF